MFSLFGIGAHRTLTAAIECTVLNQLGSVDQIAALANAGIMLSPALNIISALTTLATHITARKQIQDGHIGQLATIAFFGGVCASTTVMCLIGAFGLTPTAFDYILPRLLISLPCTAMSNACIGCLLALQQHEFVWVTLARALIIHAVSAIIAWVLCGKVLHMGALGTAAALADMSVLWCLSRRTGMYPKIPSPQLCTALTRPATMVFTNTVLFSSGQSLISTSTASLCVHALAAHQLAALTCSMLTLAGDAHALRAQVELPHCETKQKNARGISVASHITGAIVAVAAFGVLTCAPLSQCPHVTDILRQHAHLFAAYAGLTATLKGYAGILSSLAMFDRMVLANTMCVVPLALVLMCWLPTPTLKQVWCLSIGAAAIRYANYASIRIKKLI